MKRRDVLSSALVAIAVPVRPAVSATALPQIEVFKSPYCGCCGAWADHMRGAGFDVKVHLVEDTSATRRRFGLPDKFGACHTALVGGYVVEGHVPATEVRRLLAMKPDALGLAVPAMPAGSPGMETGARKDPYQVLLIDRSGRATVFASYPKA